MTDPTQTHVPAISVEVEAGVCVMRDGWVAVFYMQPPRARHAGAVRDSIEHYLDMLSAQPLRWTIDEDGYPVEMEADDIRESLDQIEAAGDLSASLRLMDESNGVSPHRLRYVGIGSDAPNMESFPDAVSVLFFSFATQTVAALGLDRVARFCHQTAAQLEVSFAYLSPAFLYAPGAAETPAFSTIRQLCRRFKCMDVPYISADMLELGLRSRGAYWMTYLGQALIDRLGGADMLTQALRPHPEVSVGMIRDGLMVLRAGGHPQAGDVNQREDLSAYAALASVLKPIAYRPGFPFPEFSEEETQEWFDRFVPQH